MQLLSSEENHIMIQIAIKYVSDEKGTLSAVLIPIELRRDIESEKEIAHLKNLMVATERQIASFCQRHHFLTLLILHY